MSHTDIERPPVPHFVAVARLPITVQRALRTLGYQGGQIMLRAAWSCAAPYSATAPSHAYLAIVEILTGRCTTERGSGGQTLTEARRQIPSGSVALWGETGPQGATCTLYVHPDSYRTLVGKEPR